MGFLQVTEEDRAETVFVDDYVTMALTKEGENFVRLAKIILEIVPANLRILFESEWNKKFQNNKWDDTPTSGLFLVKEVKKMKVPRRSFTNDIETALAAGNKNKWDCTILFFVLFYSELRIIPKARFLKQKKLPLLPSEEVDKLREIRNGSFAHLASLSIDETEYQQVISEIEQIFTNLGWTQGLHDIQSIKSSAVSTSEMKTLERKLRQEKEKNDRVLVEMHWLKIWVFLVTIAVVLMAVVGIAVAFNWSFQTKKPRDIVAEMSTGLKLHYTDALENWTMPILRFSKHKTSFGNTKKRRKTAMIQPLLREIIEKNDENPGPRYETHPQRNLKASELQNTSLIKIRDIMKKDRKITIVQGTGGIGKTSLVDFITYQWAQNEIFKQEEGLQFLFVFRFQCRSLNRYDGRSLTAKDLFSEKFNVNISNINAVRGENILIVLDGFDEFFAYRDIFNIDNKEDSITSIVRSLLTQETVLFPGHYTLVTGRHHAVDVLQKREKSTGKARWVEVLGFSEHAVEKYVDDQFSEGNSSLAAYIKNRIASSVALQSLATTPVFLRTLCSILCLEDVEFDATSMVKMTDIYSWIVGSFLKFHFASKEREFSDISLGELLSREDVRLFLRDLSRDSYELLIANELEFDCKKLSSVNMSDPVIRNLVSGFVLKSEDEIESKCEFWHVTMQEFFAGYYCFKNNINVSTLQKDNWFQAVQFVAGFSSARNKKRKDIKHILLGDSLFLKQDSIDMILSLFSDDAFFHSNYSRELKRNYLQIFFEAFDAEDEIPFLVGKRAGSSENATWEIYSLSDASLFIHFARLMIANRMEMKLGKVTLIIRSITLKYATFDGLFQVIPFCHILYLDSVHMGIPLSKETSSRLLARFKTGQHTLVGISLSYCIVSKDVNCMFINIIPLIREVVLIHQHILFQDAGTTSISIAKTRYQHPTKSTMVLQLFTSIACTFEKGSGKELGKILAFVKVVKIHYLQEEFNEIKAITQGIRRVLADTSISMFEKIQNFTLTAVEQTVVHGDFIALAKSLSYLQVVDLGEAVLTNGFVSKLVKCFLALIEKDRYAVRLKRLRIHSSLSSKRTFTIEKLAKIIPFIQVVDLRYFQLSLYDYKILSDAMSKAANSNLRGFGSGLLLLRLGNVFDGLFLNFNSHLKSFNIMYDKLGAVLENVLKTRQLEEEVWNNYDLITDAENAIRSYSSSEYGKGFPVQATIARMLSRVDKKVGRITQKANVLLKEIVDLVAKTTFLIASEKGRSSGQLLMKRFFTDQKVIDSLGSNLLSETRRLSKLVRGLKRDSDQWVLEIKRRIRDEAVCALLPDTTLSSDASDVHEEKVRQKLSREKVSRLEKDLAIIEQISFSLRDARSHLAMSMSSLAKMKTVNDKFQFENRMLNALKVRQKNQVLSYVAKMVSYVPIVDMSDNDISTYDLCSQLFKKIRDVKINEQGIISQYQGDYSLLKLILGANFKSCGKAIDILRGYVFAVEEDAFANGLAN
eukprot:Seg2846.4 transcript_id=Seg2846.4/GoldUCD/mRNA.D3Y31 product="NACHT LRR and PYD domains-containing protein 1" protein_id=Seg2846.4/GoldUCD/D3Y31